MRKGNSEIDICMIVSNTVTPDPRVRKEAASLADSDYKVKIIGLRLNKDDKPKERFSPGYEVERANVSFLTQKVRRKIDQFMTGDSALKKKLGFPLKVLLKAYQMVWLSMKTFGTKATVYHAHDLDTLPIAFIASFIHRSKLVYDSHELYTEQKQGTSAVIKRCLQIVEGMLIKRADRVITVNGSIAEELQKRYNVALPLSLKNYVSQNMTPVKTITRGTIREVSVLYHGGFMPDRGLEEMIQSVEYWPDDCKLFIRGFGSIENELRQLVADLKLTEKITFLEPVTMEQLTEGAAFADIGIIPYKPTCLNNYYSLPNKLSEYIMAGLAVCASDLPEIRKLNDQVHFGELFDPEDPKSIAEAIRKMVSEREYLLQYRENAWEWARMEGNWEEESKKLLFLYANLLGENHEKHLDC
ncbi:Glyco_trans_4-like_N domain-containing protein [Brevibacillus sp. IT-7CA2]